MKKVRSRFAIGIIGILTMAFGTERAGACRQHRIVGFGDGVIAVAFAAFSPMMLVECLLVLTSVEETGIS